MLKFQNSYFKTQIMNLSFECLDKRRLIKFHRGYDNLTDNISTFNIIAKHIF